MTNKEAEILQRSESCLLDFGYGMFKLNSKEIFQKLKSEREQTMKAAYLKAKYQFEVREAKLREPEKNEVEIAVKACGFCGHDNILASYAATDWEPFGHEFAGIVTKIGSDVTNVNVGDRVTMETSTFNPFSEAALNGRPDLCTDCTDYMKRRTGDTMGFAERTIAPANLIVNIGDLSFEEACILEPMGVAADLVMTADIHLNDDVLLLGAGPIGLMAMQMAKRSGARHIYVAQLSGMKARVDLAYQYGADDVIFTDQQSLEEYPFPRGGVDKVMVTSPPSTIDLATRVTNPGGTVAFLGIGYGDRAKATFDSNIVHLRKISIRGSNAIPALYFPRCIDLIKSGMADVKSLISHRFRLEELPEAIVQYLKEEDKAVKAIMYNE